MTSENAGNIVFHRKKKYQRSNFLAKMSPVRCIGLTVFCCPGNGWCKMTPLHRSTRVIASCFFLSFYKRLFSFSLPDHIKCKEIELLCCTRSIRCGFKSWYWCTENCILLQEKKKLQIIMNLTFMYRPFKSWSRVFCTPGTGMAWSAFFTWTDPIDKAIYSVSLCLISRFNSSHAQRRYITL